MRFFKAKAMISEKWDKEKSKKNASREIARKIKRISNEFNHTFEKEMFFFVSDIEIEDYGDLILEDSDDDFFDGDDIDITEELDGNVIDKEDSEKQTATIGIICRNSSEIEKFFSDYLEKLRFERLNEAAEEVTLEEISYMLSDANMSHFIENANEVLENFDLEKITKRGCYSHLSYGENVIKSATEKELYDEANTFFSRESFIAELDRIYEGAKQEKVVGHPVHYIIQTDNHDARKLMCRNLLSALYANGRLLNRRYAFTDISVNESNWPEGYEALYKSCEGGAMLVRYNAENDLDEENCFANANREIIGRICNVMKMYRNKVLTVFCFPCECARVKEIFYENLGSTSIVEINDELVSSERAEQYLRQIAGDGNIKPDEKLFEKLEDGKGYNVRELEEMFNEWYEKKLKTGIYPQYSGIVPVNREVIKMKPKGSAYGELMKMIGLTEAKKVINQALDYYKAQKLFKNKGMIADRPSMHMVFTGNPGTAKTSVARLFSEIMKENGILSEGKLIEVGRGDLVGKYVGWTAPTIKKKFQQARGGVLFIDEAYSLVDDRDGSYGDEAINTIVQEMENHRDDVVVIFAGYPDKMESFLDKNPGLRSRIAFHVRFDDYNSEELCGIASLIAEQKGLVLENEAREKLKTVFDIAREKRDFGNGRYVRNVVEKAKMAQVSRVLRMDPDSIGKKELETICAEDIELPVSERADNLRRIGFCA